MELRQIRSFLSIAETLHFGRYCGVIHLKPTSLKPSIRALEEDVARDSSSGTDAKQRSPRLVSPFAIEAARALSQLDQSDSPGEAGCQWKTGTLADRLHPNCRSEIVPDIFRQFRELIRGGVLLAAYNHGGSGTDVGNRVPRHRISSSADWLKHLALDVCHRTSRTVRTRSTCVPQTRKKERVRLREVSGQNFVMYERAYAPGFHDLIFGMLRDARIVPNVSQTAAELSTMISLVDAHMGVAILPYRS